MTAASGRPGSTRTAVALVDDLAELGPLTLGRFLGGTGLRLEEIQFGFVMRNSVYLRVDEATRPDFEQLGSEPFRYQAGGRTVTVRSYYRVPDAVRKDQAQLVRRARQAHHVARTARIAR